MGFLRRWGLLLLVAVIVGWLLISTAGKDCHYNVNVSDRVVCSEERGERGAR